MSPLTSYLGVGVCWRCVQGKNVSTDVVSKRKRRLLTQHPRGQGVDWLCIQGENVSTAFLSWERWCLPKLCPGEKASTDVVFRRRSLPTSNSGGGGGGAVEGVCYPDKGLYWCQIKGGGGGRGELRPQLTYSRNKYLYRRSIQGEAASSDVVFRGRRPLMTYSGGRGLHWLCSQE